MWVNKTDHAVFCVSFSHDRKLALGLSNENLVTICVYCNAMFVFVEVCLLLVCVWFLSYANAARRHL